MHLNAAQALSPQMSWRLENSVSLRWPHQSRQLNLVTSVNGKLTCTLKSAMVFVTSVEPGIRSQPNSMKRSSKKVETEQSTTGVILHSECDSLYAAYCWLVAEKQIVLSHALLSLMTFLFCEICDSGQAGPRACATSLCLLEILFLIPHFWLGDWWNLNSGHVCHCLY